MANLLSLISPSGVRGSSRQNMFYSKPSTQFKVSWGQKGWRQLSARILSKHTPGLTFVPSPNFILKSVGTLPCLHNQYFWNFDRQVVNVLTHSVLWNETLIPLGCAQATHGTMASFRELYFCCLGKHNQTETDFKTNFLLMKGENFITSYCIVLTFKSAKIWQLVKEILVFWSIGYILFMGDDSKYKVDNSDNRWVLDSE